MPLTDCLDANEYSDQFFMQGLSHMISKLCSCCASRARMRIEVVALSQLAVYQLRTTTRVGFSTSPEAEVNQHFQLIKVNRLGHVTLTSQARRLGTQVVGIVGSDYQNWHLG